MLDKSVRSAFIPLLVAGAVLAAIGFIVTLVPLVECMQCS